MARYLMSDLLTLVGVGTKKSPEWSSAYLALKQATTQWLLGRVSSLRSGAAVGWNGRAVRFDSGWFVSVSLASQLGCRCRLRRVGASGLRLRFAEELAAARERSGVALNNATRRPDAGRPVAHAPRVCSEHSPDDSSSKNSFNDQVIQASPAIRSRSVRGRRCGGPSSRSDTARV